MSSNRMKACLPCAIIFAGLSAAAPALGIEPANAQLGPFYITPTLNVESRYTDNLFRSEDNEKSTWILDTLPKVQTWLQNGNSTYSATVQLQDFRYASSSDDDFTDYQGNVDIHQEFNAKNTLDAFGKWYSGHEERGTGLAEGDVSQAIDKPVELDTIDYGASYTLGNKNTLARVVAGYRYHEREYQNFRDATRFRDYDQDHFSVAGYYGLRPRLDIVAEVRYFETRYGDVNRSDRSGSLDNDEYNYLFGLAWDATAKTSSSIKLGWYEREYESIARDEDEGFSWEADIFYEPRSYSVLNFETKRYSQETNGVGDAIDTQEYSLRWDHDWNNRSHTHLAVLKADEDYTGSQRSDDLWSAEAKYVYKFKRWFDVSGGYRYEDRDSSSRGLSFDRNVYFLRADMSL
ncbi:MAG: outer membrane beta-barrel protein [Halioglobus sp.]